MDQGHLSLCPSHAERIILAYYGHWGPDARIGKGWPLTVCDLQVLAA